MAGGNGRAGRRVIPVHDTPFQPYDRFGETLPGLSWLNLSYDEETGHGSFLVRFEPGGSSPPHEHTGIEEFMVLEGGLVDSDGAVFSTGDFVSFAPGTRHFSTAPEGCLIVVFMRGPNRLIGGDMIEKLAGAADSP